MRLASFKLDGVSTWGVLDGDEASDVGRRSEGRWPTLAAFLADRDDRALQRLVAGAGADARLDEVELLPVVPAPDKALCVGLNFESHRIETGRPRTEHPTVFSRFADSLVGHRAPLVAPAASSALDYEGEVAVVIGREIRAVAPSAALDAVAGYTLCQDATVRDFQNHSSQWIAGKNFPATGALGPALVTADEVGDYRRIELVTRVNGEERQRGRLDDLTFTVEDILAYCSTWTTLRPGDVVAIGTPGGIGSKHEPPSWLAPGDVVEVVAEPLGRLVNPVTAER